MNEQLVAKETAELAKEKGFWWDTHYFLKFKDNGKPVVDYGWNNPNRTDDTLNVPTQALLQKYIRDEFNKNIYPVKNKYGWVCIIIDIEDEDDYFYSNIHQSYEKALEDGLCTFLEKL